MGGDYPIVGPRRIFVRPYAYRGSITTVGVLISWPPIPLRDTRSAQSLAGSRRSIIQSSSCAAAIQSCIHGWLSTAST